MKKCKTCGKEFKQYSSTQKYCSYLCTMIDLVPKNKCKTKIRLPEKKRIKNPLIKSCDNLWSLAVKIFAGNKCEKCKSTGQLNSHHIFGRRSRAVRWNVNNGVCLCPLHHQLSSKFSAHQTPLTFSTWIRNKRGEDWYSNLRDVFNAGIKPDKENVIYELRKIIYTKKLPF